MYTWDAYGNEYYEEIDTRLLQFLTPAVNPYWLRYDRSDAARDMRKEYRMQYGGGQMVGVERAAHYFEKGLHVTAETVHGKPFSNSYSSNTYGHHSRYLRHPSCAYLRHAKTPGDMEGCYCPWPMLWDKKRGEAVIVGIAIIRHATLPEPETIMRN
jgi:hypothetical protein